MEQTTTEHEAIIEQEAPIIKLLPDSDVNFLQAKREEYKARLIRRQEKHSYAHPKSPKFADTIYKLALLSVLLDSPEVEINTYEWSRRLHKIGYIHEEFNNACGVVEFYLKNGDKEVC